MQEQKTMVTITKETEANLKLPKALYYYYIYSSAIKAESTIPVIGALLKSMYEKKADDAHRKLFECGVSADALNELKEKGFPRVSDMDIDLTFPMYMRYNPKSERPEEVTYEMSISICSAVADLMTSSGMIQERCALILALLYSYGFDLGVYVAGSISSLVQSILSQMDMMCTLLTAKRYHSGRTLDILMDYDFWFEEQMREKEASGLKDRGDK